METKQGIPGNNSGRPVDTRGPSRLHKPRRVTREMVIAAGRAARKANEEAREARLRGRRRP